MSHQIALLVMTDGRRAELDQTIDSAFTRLRGGFNELYLHDDTGNASYRQQLARAYPQFRHIGRGSRRGFGGAVAHAWEMVTILTSASTNYLFHLEADFTFNREVDLQAIGDTMLVNPHLAQMALRRQAWSPEETAAGGVVEMWPDAYADREAYNGTRWLEHRLFYTTNPHLTRMGRVRRGWPNTPRSEAEYTKRLLHDPGLQFGYWGARTDDPWVHHIGHTRVGTGY